MNVRSIALVFDDRMRPDTTGVHCLRALESHVKVTHFRPDQLPEINVADFDLFIRIDDDQHFSWPAHLRPSACWLIDTFRDFELRLRHASEFDHVFLAQRTDVSSFRARIGRNVDWLPLGCNPSVHRRLPIDRNIDIGFVGNVVHAERERYLRVIAQHFPSSFIGSAFGDDLTAVYNKSRIGFNKSLVGDVNMRVFEVTGCGTLLLTDAVTENGLEELFKIDQEIVTYADTHEMIDKSSFYIRNEASREHIAKRALDAAHQKHTYRHRMETIISAMEHRPSTFPLSLGSVQVPSICIESSIDILIKSFLRPAALLCLLQSIRQFYPNVSVTVLDDGNLSTSDDDASRVCLRYINEDRHTSLITLPFGSGVSQGRNRLIEATTKPFLLFLDDDFIMTPTTNLNRLLDMMLADETLGVAAGICNDVVDSERHVRKCYGFLSISRGVLFHDRAKWERKRSSRTDYFPVFALYRRAMFDDGIRWRGPIGGEHFDMCLQIKGSCWGVGIDASVSIDHDLGAVATNGYRAYRDNVIPGQKWLLDEWGLREIRQDGAIIAKSVSLRPTEVPVDSATQRKERTPFRDNSYFHWARPDILALVPKDAARILEIGCAAGMLGSELKARQPCYVVGVDLDSQCVESARSVLDEAYCLDVEQDVNGGQKVQRRAAIICSARLNRSWTWPAVEG